QRRNFLQSSCSALCLSQVDVDVSSVVHIESSELDVEDCKLQACGHHMRGGLTFEAGPRDTVRSCWKRRSRAAAVDSLSSRCFRGVCVPMMMCCYYYYYILCFVFFPVIFFFSFCICILYIYSFFSFRSSSPLMRALFLHPQFDRRSRVSGRTWGGAFTDIVYGAVSLAPAMYLALEAACHSTTGCNGTLAARAFRSLLEVPANGLPPLARWISRCTGLSGGHCPP
ncbi:hypothetical protein BDZ91DRAFT_819276, partial [Kalaharituber pfeilii]